ncbi:MAG: phosphotransferase [Acidimicrobiia bacterium]
MEPASEIVHRLIDAGLLSTGDVVDGRLTVVDLSRSNAVCLVDAGGAGRFVAKVAAPDRDDLQGSGAVETMLYERIAADPVLAATAPVPRLVGRFGTLIVLAPVGQSDSLLRRLRDRGPTAADGRLLGEALGRWRAVGSVLPTSGLPGRLPWVAGALGDTPPQFLGEHPATRRLGQLLAGQAVLGGALTELARHWRRDGVMHGDVRWDNVVVTDDPEVGRERALLVDLEFADLGDGAWDVAGAVAEPLAVAVTSSVAGGGGEGGVDVTDRRTVGRHLRELRPFVACFAAAYRAAAGPPADEDLRRGMAFVPARLVQAAFQYAAWDPSSGVAAGLALAGLAAGLRVDDRLLAGMLAQPVAALAGRGSP